MGSGGYNFTAWIVMLVMSKRCGYLWNSESSLSDAGIGKRSSNETNPHPVLTGSGSERMEAQARVHRASPGSGKPRKYGHDDKCTARGCG